MPKNTDLAGAITLRQQYARNGTVYAELTMPRSIVEALDLRPGDTLQYYVSDEGSIVFIPIRTALMGRPGFDPEKLKRRGEWKAPKPGSMAEITLRADRGWAEIEATSAETGRRLAERRKREREEQEIQEREGKKHVNRMTRQAKALAHGRRYRSRRG